MYFTDKMHLFNTYYYILHCLSDYLVTEVRQSIWYLCT